MTKNLTDKIIDGKKLAYEQLVQVRQEILKLKSTPGLAAILIGDNPSSQLYVKLKKEACEKCDIHFSSYKFSSTCDEKEILETIKFLNEDPEIDGILVQLPLPEKFDTEKIITAIDYRKDIDGFHPHNRSQMETCNYKILPPLPLGIAELVHSVEAKPTNQKICIFCNHKLFGQPFKCLWGKDNQVDIITTEDTDWKNFIKEADILIVSIGIPFFIDKEMIKKDCLIIDVGINKLDNGEVVGDVNIADVIDTVKAITPVPGGVGPMTVATLLKNLVILHKNKK